MDNTTRGAGASTRNKVASQGPGGTDFSNMGPGKVQDEQCAVNVSAMICEFEKNVQPSKSLGKLDWMPPKLMGLLYSLLPTSSLLALRCCSKVRTTFRTIDSLPA
jgi:hypothetical protein